MKNRILHSVFSFTLAMVLVLLLSKCSKEEVIVCGIENVCGEVEDLSWFEAEVESQSEMYNKYFYVIKATYRGEVVFVFQNCCPNCGTIVPVKNCSGTTIGYLGSGEDAVNSDELLNSVIIWKAPENECVFTN
jgi:hypothetical protein